MKDLKQATQEYVAFDNQKTGGCSMGCIGIGCFGAIALMFMMCGGGFYGLLYSSLPLKAIEAAIESDGNVEIDGLKGNITNGFAADEFRFKADNENWSNLRDIKFKYSNNRMFNPDRFVIEEISIDGGTIYADWDPEKSEIAIDPDFEEGMEEFEEEFEDISKEIEDELSGSGLENLKEVRVDLIRVANLKVVNPKTELEFTLDEIKFDGFHWEDGELISVGELLVRSTQLELDTVASIEFPDEPYSQRFQGFVRSQMDHRLKTDVDFSVDFAVIDGKFHAEGKALKGAVCFTKNSEENSLTFNDFTPVDILKVAENHIAPSKISFTAYFGESMKEDPESLSEDGSFQLGKTVFNGLFIDSEKDKPATVAGVAEVNGTTVTARVIPSSRSPFWLVSLSSEDKQESKEVWAQTVFGKSYSELSEERQLAVTESSSIPLVRKKRIDKRKREGDEGAEEDLEDVVDEAQELIDEIESDIEKSSGEVGSGEESSAEQDESAPFPIGADDG